MSTRRLLFSAEMALTSRRSATIEADGRQITLTPDLVTIQRKTFKQSGRFLLVFQSRSAR